MFDKFHIAISVNKKDIWFCKILVSSIRYFYPKLRIVILKDDLNGKFSTVELQKRFNVEIANLEKKIFGWSASKIFYLLSLRKGEKVLLLDSDIIFLDPFIEKLIDKIEYYDFVVNADFHENPYQDWVTYSYFDIKKIEKFNDNYIYPGYFFNAGQLFATGGSINLDDLKDNFDPKEYPYWINREIFPLVDQSAYNYIFPQLEGEKKIRVAAEQFMFTPDVDKKLLPSIESVKNKDSSVGLLHWAGGYKNINIKKMKYYELLKFFENYYYKDVFLGKLKCKIRVYKSEIKYFTIMMLVKLKHKIEKIFNLKFSFKYNP
jgi:hypothetical protein